MFVCVTGCGRCGIAEAMKASSLAAAHDLFDTPPAGGGHEPEEDGRGTKILHTLVGDLAADVKSLSEEIKTLMAKLQRLERA